ncbi:MAG: hypothetical protein Q4G35_09245 [Propionibacteriaceae bacterium]|nr:hypothetical protein [Propionibacteriaceae bacterium]
MTPELSELMSLANQTPWGAACTSLWMQALQLAEAEGDDEALLDCHIELASAQLNDAESTRAVVPFLWVEQQWRAHPERFDERQTNRFGWMFRNIASALQAVPSVPAQQIEDLLGRMEAHHLQQGESLRAVHARRLKLALSLGDQEGAEESYRRWFAAEPGGELADCEGCDPLVEIYQEIRDEDWEAAYRRGSELLARPMDGCAAQPERTLASLLEPMIRTGRDAEAWAAHVRAYRKHQSRPAELDELPDHLTYLALSGLAGRPERLERGKALFLRHIAWWTKADTPMDLLRVSTAALQVLRALPDDPATVLPVTLPGADIQWAPQPTVVNPTLAQAREWLHALALEIATAFDARPGMVRQHFVANLERKLELTPVPDLPAVPVPDVAGLTEPDEEDYALVGAAVEEEAPVPVELAGDWQRMSVPELLRAAHASGVDTRSVYSYAVRARMFAGVERPADLTGVEAEQWDRDWAEYQTLIVTPDEISVAQVTEDADEAWRLISQADERLGAEDGPAAAELAYEAMRLPTSDPLGVRLSGLQIMGWAAIEAGYFADAIGPLRQALNLAAACGFTPLRVIVGGGLAFALSKVRRPLEATEVAQNTLALLENHPEADFTIMVQKILADDLTRLGYHGQAGQWHAASARATTDPEAALAAWEEATKAFTEADEFADAIDAARHTVSLAEEMFAGGDVAGLRRLAEVLSAAAYTIVFQPGLVPEEQMAEVERHMDRQRGVLQLPGVAVDPAGVDAVWQHTMGRMYALGGQSVNAIDMLRAARVSFLTLKRAKDVAAVCHLLAQTHLRRHEQELAVEALEEGLALLDTPVLRHCAEAVQLRRTLDSLG